MSCQCPRDIWAAYEQRTGRNRSGRSYFGTRKWCERMTALFTLRTALRDWRAVLVHVDSLDKLPSERPSIVGFAFRHAPNGDSVGCRLVPDTQTKPRNYVENVGEGEGGSGHGGGGSRTAHRLCLGCYYARPLTLLSG